jgi:tetratricopeptide (TPR) repeat protein
MILAVVATGLGVLIAALLSAAAGASPSGEADRLAAIDEYAVTLALTGDFARAESLFVSLLSSSPKDARALNNLGNLYLIRGEPEIAEAFYGQAMIADTTDFGIPLNLAIALMLSGRNEAAGIRAAEAIEKAGGIDKAASLLSLRSDEIDSKGSDATSKAYLSKKEVMALLKTAGSAVPAISGSEANQDSTAASEIKPSGQQTKPAAWRSAGLRGSDLNEMSTSLYWKM